MGQLLVKSLQNLSWDKDLTSAYEKILQKGQGEGVYPEDLGDVNFHIEVKYIGPRVAPRALITYYYWNPRKVWIDTLWVEPEHRRKGCAGALIKAVLAEAKEKGCISVHLSTLSGNIKMHEMIQRLFFKPRSVNYEYKFGKQKKDD